MFKLSQEDINKMKEEVKKLKKKIERLEFVIRINEYDPNEHKVYENKNDNNHLTVTLETPCDGRAVNINQYYDFFNSQKSTIFDVCEPPFECCKNCSNNLKNNKFASGFCCCDLPYKEMIIW